MGEGVDSFIVNGGLDLDEMMETLNLCDEGKYELIIFENVDSMCDKIHKASLAWLMFELRRRNFHYRFRKVNAVIHGASTNRTRLHLVASKNPLTMQHFEWPFVRKAREQRKRSFMLPESQVPPELWGAGGEKKITILTDHHKLSKETIGTHHHTHRKRLFAGKETYSSFRSARQDTGTRTASSRRIPNTITASTSSGQYLWHNNNLRSISGCEAMLVNIVERKDGLLYTRLTPSLHPSPFFYLTGVFTTGLIQQLQFIKRN